MRKRYWKSTAAMILAGVMVFGMSGCGRMADIAVEAIGLNQLESALGIDESDTSGEESTDSGREAESKTPETESTVSEAESGDSSVESGDSSVESGDSSVESADSSVESTASETESTESDESTDSGDESGETESKAPEKVIITGEGLDIDALSAIDNTRYTAGYASQFRDDLNRPQETVKLQERFGSDKSEFLHGTDKSIHLVFTAGYTNESTNQILNVLKEKGVKATFFLTGYCMEDSPAIVQRIIDEGHTLGSHSYSHPTLGMQSYSVQQIIEDSMHVQEIIRDRYNYEIQYYSFPSGEFSERALETVKAMGYHVVFDSFAYKDYDPADQISPDAALNALYAEMHVGEILLMHASSSTSAQVLANFIDGANKLGFWFENYE